MLALEGISEHISEHHRERQITHLKKKKRCFLVCLSFFLQQIEPLSFKYLINYIQCPLSSGQKYSRERQLKLCRSRDKQSSDAVLVCLLFYDPIHGYSSSCWWYIISYVLLIYNGKLIKSLQIFVITPLFLCSLIIRHLRPYQ